MNKSELIDQITQKTGLQKSVSTQVFEATLESISDALRVGDSVAILGFGTFLVKDKPARVGRNPKTGESMQIAAKKAPAFKAGKGLKDILNK